jgi:hypothetical protein
MSRLVSFHAIIIFNIKSVLISRAGNEVTDALKSSHIVPSLLCHLEVRKFLSEGDFQKSLGRRNVYVGVLLARPTSS